MTKTAFITGATSGIGRGAAIRLARLGMNLVITGRRAERLVSLADELRRECHVAIHHLEFDVRDRNQVNAAIDSLPAEFQNINILVNNAGLAAGLEHIYEGDTDDWDRMIDTNIKGALYITRRIAPLMVERGSGHIINIGSIAGVQTYENGGVYCASKHAMHALSQSMRIDMLKHGIRVSEIRPGMVETEFSEVRFHGDSDRAGGVYQGVTPLSADDIASVIEWIVCQPPHININDIEVMPTQQADAFYTYRHTSTING